jgi:hypothetical protein
MGRIASYKLRDWLAPQAPSIVSLPKIYVTDGRVTDMPDRQISIQRVGGTRVVMQGQFEEAMFRFEYRGKSNDLEDAEKIALAMDSFIWGQNNITIADCYVTAIDYGSPPRQLPSSDNNSRYSFTADYKFLASREG